MNARVKELYEEATGKDWAYDFDPHVAEKFAELIVREVFAKIENERFEVYQLVKESVMKHFGVTE